LRGGPQTPRLKQKPGNAGLFSFFCFARKV